MAQIFGEFPEALRNTVAIAERCDVDLSATENHLPSFDVPEGFTVDGYFEHVVREGFRERLPRLRELEQRGALLHPIAEYEEKLAYEVDVIKRMRYPGYFLIVWDFIPLRARPRHSRRPRPRVGGGQPGGLLPAHHGRRSAGVRPDLRALPQSRARIAARHRHRLLRAAGRRGDRVRHPQVRPRERRPDHHLRHAEGARRGARRGAHAGHVVRRRGPRREADPGHAGHDARQGGGRERGAQGDVPARRAREGADRRRAPAGRRHPATRPCTPPASSSPRAR